MNYLVLSLKFYEVYQGQTQYEPTQKNPSILSNSESCFSIVCKNVVYKSSTENKINYFPEPEPGVVSAH